MRGLSTIILLGAVALTPVPSVACSCFDHLHPCEAFSDGDVVMTGEVTTGFFTSAWRFLTSGVFSADFRVEEQFKGKPLPSETTVEAGTCLGPFFDQKYYIVAVRGSRGLVAVNCYTKELSRATPDLQWAEAGKVRIFSPPTPWETPDPLVKLRISMHDETWIVQRETNGAYSFESSEAGAYSIRFLNEQGEEVRKQANISLQLGDCFNTASGQLPN